MDGFGNPASWGALIGTVLPFIVAFVNQATWSKQKRQVVSVVVAIVAGVGTVLVSGQYDVSDWINTIIVVIGASQAAYALLWHPTGLAPAVERATSKSVDPTHRNEEGEIAFSMALAVVVGSAFIFLCGVMTVWMLSMRL